MANNRKQTHYYHVGETNSSFDFKVKIKLRPVVSAFCSTHSSMENMLHDIECTVGWQEKIRNPHEKPVSTYTHSSLNPMERIGEVDGRDKALQTTADHGAKTHEEACVYTYIDNEYRCAPCLVEQGDSLCTHLAYSVQYLPIHNLHSTKTMSHNSARVHDRLSREDPFQVMYIVAAVDCQRPNRDKNTATNHKYEFHEELLCMIKLYKSGLVEATPGFSTVEPEDSDNEIFSSSKCLETKLEKGPNLSTFTFSTPLGSIYQYSIEWLDYIIDEDLLENLSLKVEDEQHQIQEERRVDIVSNMWRNKEFIDRSLSVTNGEELFQIEFESVEILNPLWNHSSIRIDYELILPEGWNYTLISDDMKYPDVGNCVTGSTTIAQGSSSGGKHTQGSLVFMGIIILQIVIIFDLNFTAIIIATVLWLVSYEIVFHCNSMNLPKRSAFVHKSIAHQICFIRELPYNKVHVQTDKEIEQIKMFFNTCTCCNDGRCSVGGYGSLVIPVHKSCKNVFNVHTARFIRSNSRWIEAMYRIHDYYFGCSFIKLSDYKHFITEWKNRCGEKSNATFKSEVSGTVRIKSQMRKINLNDKSHFHKNKAVKSTVDKVLNKVRRRRTSDQSNNLCFNAVSSEENIGGKTKALLSRVKQRKEERKNKLIL